MGKQALAHLPSWLCPFDQLTLASVFPDDLLLAAIQLVLSVPREFADISMLLPALNKCIKIGTKWVNSVGLLSDAGLLNALC